MTRALLRRRTPLLAVAALTALCACGRGESHWQMRSAGQWGEFLWGAPEEVTTAERALRALRAHDPQGVIAALEKAMQTRPPKPTATPFSLAIDVEGVKRLGLTALPAAEAVQLDLAIVRERIRAMSIGTASIKGGDEVDVVLRTPLPRADLLRLQARLSVRGALDLQAVAFDPRRPPRGEEAGEASKVLADEVARFVAARAAKRAYAPADARRRAVPRAGTAAATPADFLLVVEPPVAGEALDERSIVSATTGRSPEGFPAVVAHWAEAAKARVARFAEERAGRRYAVVLDGIAAATPDTPAPSATSWTVPVAETDDPAAHELATTLAIAWPLGRLPYPLVPVPPAADYGVDPPPDNQVSRVTAGFGKLVDPMLIRLSKNAPEAWTRAAAAWAHSEIERGVGAHEGE